MKTSKGAFIAPLLLLMLSPTGYAKASNQGFLNSDQTCAVGSSSNTEVDFAKQIHRPLHSAQLKINGALYCDSELAKRFLFSKGTNGRSKATYQEYVDARDRGEIEVLINRAWRLETNASVWGWSLIPSELVRAKVADMIMLENNLVNSRLLTLKEAVARLVPQTTCQRSSTSTRTSGSPRPYDAERYGLKKDVATKFACMELMGITQALSCDSSFAVIEKLSPPNSVDVAGSGIFSKVLDDSRYDEGIRLAALKLAERVSEPSPGGNYFDDVKNAFLAAGAGQIEAEEMAWNTVGLLATGGPNIRSRLSAMGYDNRNDQKVLAIAVIAATLPVLDHRSSRNGQVYSFPSSVKVSCNSGKSYHFWLTAYLARRAALETGNPEAAAAASFQAQKFYQGMIRSSAMDMAASPLYSPASGIVRADLAYAAAGAVYGANRAGNRTPIGVDVDKILLKLLERGGDGSAGAVMQAAQAVAGEKAQVYVDWAKKFSPNDAFTESRLAGFPTSVATEYLEFEKTPQPPPLCEEASR